MERFTQWFGNGTCRVAGMAAEHEEMHTTDELIDLLLDRLAVYEDTGMEPEEINALREFCESTTSTTLRHIYELVQAEREGRLVVKPHKVPVPSAPARQVSEETLKALEQMGANVHSKEGEA